MHILLLGALMLVCTGSTDHVGCDPLFRASTPLHISNLISSNEAGPPPTHQTIPHQIAHSVHCTALNAALHWPLHCTGDYIASNLILHWLLHCTKGCTLKSTALYWWPIHCTEGCTEVGTALHTATSYRLYTKTTKSILLTVRWNRHCIVRHNSHSSWKTSYIVTMSSHDTKDNNLHTIQYIWYSIQNFCSYATREM